MSVWLSYMGLSALQSTFIFVIKVVSIRYISHWYSANSLYASAGHSWAGNFYLRKSVMLRMHYGWVILLPVLAFQLPDRILWIMVHGNLVILLSVSLKHQCGLTIQSTHLFFTYRELFRKNICRFLYLQGQSCAFNVSCPTKVQ